MESYGVRLVLLGQCRFEVRRDDLKDTPSNIASIRDYKDQLVLGAFDIISPTTPDAPLVAKVAGISAGVELFHGGRLCPGSHGGSDDLSGSQWVHVYNQYSDSQNYMIE